MQCDSSLKFLVIAYSKNLVCFTICACDDSAVSLILLSGCCFFVLLFICRVFAAGTESFCFEFVKRRSRSKLGVRYESRSECR